ncbi:MAG: DUF362 domain-containing protein [Nitrospirota bacterium]|nr:DUF362 domain-containing protein [Nitrospirota bacterium]
MITRRKFLIVTAGGLILATAGEGGKMLMAGESPMGSTTEGPSRGKTKIALVKTSDRATGIARAIDLLGINPVKGKDVLLKPNFNTADPFPGSTHNDTLTHLILHLKKMGSKHITIGERSGPPDTADVLRDMGIYDLCKKLDVGIINFEELPEKDWRLVTPAKSHWRNGFLVAAPVLDAECVVATCCLKTHQYGGVFTMSLKLAVGITHKKNMKELHSSFLSMRKMIAEINQAYTPSLIVMDAIEAFVDGGPMTGKKKRADVIVAGTDRVAIDAVGLAILKELGSNRAIMDTKIFEQDQIARAAELGLGVARPEDIELVADDDAGRQYAGVLGKILSQG